jgi:hypothetical protein
MRSFLERITFRTDSTSIVVTREAACLLKSDEELRAYISRDWENVVQRPSDEDLEFMARAVRDLLYHRDGE